VEGAIARKDHGVRLVDGARILGDEGGHADAGEDALHRAEVPPPVIDDRDHRPTAFPSSTAARSRCGIDPRGLGQRAAHRLEDRLGDVVQIVAVVHGDVQRDFRVERERAEVFLQHVHVEVRHARARHRHAEDQERAPGEIDGGLHERLVHRHEGGAVADDALLVAQRLLERLAQHDADVLDRVVDVHLDVAAGLDGEIHEAVLGPGLQHVAEEGNRRLDLGASGAVQVELHGDFRLLRLALDARLPPVHGFSPPARRAAARP
jgi:hypothetical protein